MIFRSRYSIGKVSGGSHRSKGVSYQLSRNRRQRVLKFFKLLLLVGGIVFPVGAIFLALVLLFISPKLPDVKTINTYIPAETTQIISADGVVLADLHHEENRLSIPLEQISPIVQKAVIALEDANFYNHHGMDIKAILRALYKDIKAMKFVEGGSTLTQQLAKNLFLHKKKKIMRKIEEMVLAIQIERHYTKEEILELYLNQVYWGHNTYGIESAAQMYFGKPSQELRLSESAMLVGLLKGPELYSPYRNLPGAKARQKNALDRMKKLGLITEEEWKIAYLEPLQLADRKRHRYKRAPYFTEYVVRQLIEMYGEEATFTSGMKVYTTLNWEWQREAEGLVQKYIDYGKQMHLIPKENVMATLNYSQTAILAIDPTNGHIKVMQGGIDYNYTQFNRTTQAKRQPGSAFKPFVYLAALQKGFSPGSIIDDSPITFNTATGPYSPVNYTKEFKGPISLRRALELSINVVAVKLNSIIGPEAVIATARKLGVTSPLYPVLSLPLGASEITMLELVSAYGVLANEGRRVEPTSILRIEDRDGTPMYSHQRKERKVFDENLIFTLVDMMKGIVKNGTGKNAMLPARPIAGKTGTTSDYKDAWFCGFVPQLVCATWVGNDDNTPMNHMTGGWVPALMWRDFMKFALENMPRRDFPTPAGLVTRTVNWRTGSLAGEASPEDSVHEEQYWKGKEPINVDSILENFKKSEKKDEQQIIEFFEL